jgi:hypothetical protein
MGIVPELQPGDEVLCVHCDRWHVVEQLYADAPTSAHDLLYVTCLVAPGRFVVGPIGSVPTWAWRRRRDPSEGDV